MRQYISLYHILAIITIIIWGVTFVSTKVLINHGLGPVEIFILRFGIAYVCALVISHNKLWAASPGDELMMVTAGITGGSLYFISENTALSYTFASNVSLIICCAPIFTAILGSRVYRKRLSSTLWLGSIVAFVGVAVVIFNGAGSFGINPIGDLLTGLAALSWAIYCLVLKSVNKRYDNAFITRKVFAYGVLTALLYYLLTTSDKQKIIIETWPVIWNLLFLSVGASFLCYLMWNEAVKQLGPEITTNYIYLVPLVTIVASTIILDEPFTLAQGIGTIMILAGIILATKSYS